MALDNWIIEPIDDKPNRTVIMSMIRRRLAVDMSLNTNKRYKLEIYVRSITLSAWIHRALINLSGFCLDRVSNFKNILNSKG